VKPIPVLNFLSCLLNWLEKERIFKDIFSRSETAHEFQSFAKNNELMLRTQLCTDKSMQLADTVSIIFIRAIKASSSHVTFVSLRVREQSEETVCTFGRRVKNVCLHEKLSEYLRWKFGVAWFALQSLD
jgi:hypothetical protein